MRSAFPRLDSIIQVKLPTLAQAPQGARQTILVRTPAPFRKWPLLISILQEAETNGAEAGNHISGCARAPPGPYLVASAGSHHRASSSSSDTSDSTKCPIAHHASFGCAYPYAAVRACAVATRRSPFAESALRSWPLNDPQPGFTYSASRTGLLATPEQRIFALIYLGSLGPRVEDPWIRAAQAELQASTLLAHPHPHHLTVAGANRRPSASSADERPITYGTGMNEGTEPKPGTTFSCKW